MMFKTSRFTVDCSVLYTMLLMANLILSVTGFKCYICDSKDDIECTENLPPNSRLTPHECANITGAKYCIKTTNIYAGEFGTKRFCAANHHGNYCKYVRQPAGDREYRSCVLTCDSQECNGSQTLFDRQNLLFVVLITLLSACHIYMTIF